MTAPHVQVIHTHSSSAPPSAHRSSGAHQERRPG